jgi:O-6-methylguanine DNA methyltransferase
MKNIAYQHTPIGLIELTEEHGKLTLLHFVKFQKHPETLSMVLQEAKWQLEAYFEGKRKSFNLPLHFACSTFYKEIYTTLLNTPYGSTLSYKELATLCGKPDASRAVGSAMAHNPFPIIVPCHRVLKSDGSLGSYSAAEGLKSKQWLIDHEKAVHL